MQPSTVEATLTLSLIASPLNGGHMMTLRILAWSERRESSKKKVVALRKSTTVPLLRNNYQLMNDWCDLLKHFAKNVVA